MRVRVTEPHQVNVDGELHFGGDEIDVEDERRAERWIAAGYTKAVSTKSCRSTKNKDDA